MNSGEEEEEVPLEKLAENGRSFQPKEKKKKYSSGWWIKNTHAQGDSAGSQRLI